MCVYCYKILLVEKIFRKHIKIVLIKTVIYLKLNLQFKTLSLFFHYSNTNKNITFDIKKSYKKFN